MTIENTLSKNICFKFRRNSTHTILTGILNVKEDLKENAPDIPMLLLTKSMQLAETQSDRNNSISHNFPDSIPDNSQQIDLMVSDNIANKDTSSSNNDALSNMTSMDMYNMFTQVRKINIQNIFPTHQRNIQRHHQKYQVKPKIYIIT